MALHPDFPHNPHAILDPEIRWFPADEILRDTTMDKLMPPLVAQLKDVPNEEKPLFGTEDPLVKALATDEYVIRGPRSPFAQLQVSSVNLSETQEGDAQHG